MLKGCIREAFKKIKKLNNMKNNKVNNFFYLLVVRLIKKLNYEIFLLWNNLKIGLIYLKKEMKKGSDFYQNKKI